MLNKLIRRILLITLTVIPSLILADSLLDVFQLSLTNDPELKAATFAKKAEQEIRPQTLAKLFPTIKFSSSIGKASQDIRSTWTSVPADDPDGINDDLGFSINSQVNVILNLKQPLFNLPNLRKLRVSVTKLTHAELNYRIAQQALLLRVSNRYFDVLSAFDTLNFARAEKNAIARQLQQTKNRFQVGLIAVTDVHESQARHDLALANEIKAETELANKKESLRRITGKTPTSLLSLKDDTPLTPPTPTDINDWTEAAKGSNLQIAEKKLEADILRLEMNVLRANNYPTVDFNLFYGYNKYGGSYGQTSLDGLASINLNMTLFQGNLTSSRINEKKNRFDQTLQLIEAKEREILQQTRNAYIGVLAGMSYVKALAQAQKSSGQALKATNAGFEVGTRTAIDVLNAQRELFRSQRDYALARYDYILNMLNLKASVGLLSIDDLEQINNWLH